MSWKTSAAGFVAALGAAMSLSEHKGVHAIGVLLAGLGSFLTGLAARDNNVTSEDAGAK